MFATRPTALTMDLALGAARVVLAWVFIYHGAGKLFGAFNGPGIHATWLYFSNTAHLQAGSSPFSLVSPSSEAGSRSVSASSPVSPDLQCSATW